MAAASSNEDQQLMDAVAVDDMDTVRSLIKRNAQAVALVDEDDLTAVMVAAGCGSLRTMQVLLDEGADADDMDPAGRTALHIAAAEGQARSVAALAADEASRVDRVTAITASGNTALHRAAAYGGVSVIKAIIGLFGRTKGVEGVVGLVNSTNRKGRTPLIRAARWGRVDEAKELLQAGAEVDIADRDGRTALDWAHAKGHTGVITALESSTPPEASAVASFVSECGAFADDILEEVRLAVTEAVGGDEEEFDDEEEEDMASPSAMADIRSKGRTFSVVAGLPGASLSGPTRVEGWMAKKGHLFRSWRNRWFVLDEAEMQYFAKCESKKAKGTIKLTGDSTVESSPDYHRPFVFKITTPTKSFLLQAADEDELEEWMAAVAEHIDTLTK